MRARTKSWKKKFSEKKLRKALAKCGFGTWDHKVWLDGSIRLEQPPFVNVAIHEEEFGKLLKKFKPRHYEIFWFREEIGGSPRLGIELEWNKR